MDYEYILYCSKNDRYFSSKILDCPFLQEDEWRNYTFEKDLMFIYAYPEGCTRENTEFKSKLTISLQNQDVPKAIPEVLKIIRDFNMFFSVPRSLSIALKINSTSVSSNTVHRMISIPISNEKNLRIVVTKLTKVLSNYTEGPRFASGIKLRDAGIYYEADMGTFCDNQRGYSQVVSYEKAAHLYLPIDNQRPFNHEELNVVETGYLNAHFSRMRRIASEGEANIFCAYNKSSKINVSIFEIPLYRDIDSHITAILDFLQKFDKVDISRVLHPVVPRLIDLFCINNKLYIETTSVHNTTLQQLMAKRFPVIEGKEDAKYVQDALEFIESLKKYIAHLHRCNFAIGGFTPHTLWTTDLRSFSILDLRNSGEAQSDWSIRSDQIGYLPHRKMTKAQADDESLLQIALYLFAPHATLTELYDTKKRRLDEINDRFGSSVYKYITALPGSRKRWIGSFNFIQQDDIKDLNETTIIEGLERRIKNNIDIGSPYLIHSDPLVWVRENNRFGLSHGGSGVIAALRDCEDIDRIILDWLRRANIEKQQDLNLDGGLFNGFLGVPYALVQIGRYNESVIAMLRLLKTAGGKLVSDASLRTGAAGIGMVLLDILRYRSDSTLKDAINTCIDVCEHAVNESSTNAKFFPSATPTGLLDGEGGVAFFLARAGRQLHNKKLLQLAERSLDQELGKLVKLKDGSVLIKCGNRLMPYLGRGSAGLLFPLLELGKSISIKKYSSVIYGILRACNANTVFAPGLFDGAAGLLVGVALAKHICTKMLLAPFPAVNRAVYNLKKYLLFDQEGISVPGSFCLRLSDDLATGSCGVIYALKVYTSSISDDFALSKEDEGIAKYSH